MAMSDCPKCWDTPCTCGHEYENSSDDFIKTMYNLFGKIIKERGLLEEKSIIEKYSTLLQELNQVGLEMGYSNIFDNYNYRLPLLENVISSNAVFEGFILNSARTGNDASAVGYKNIEIKTNTLSTLSITENSIEMQFDKQNDSLRREETLKYNAFMASVFSKEDLYPIVTVVFKSDKAKAYINNKIKEEQEKFIDAYNISVEKGKRIRDNISIRPLKFIKYLEEEDVEIFYKLKKISKETFLSKVLNKRIEDIDV